MGNASNQGAQNFLNNLVNAITSDLGAPGALANGLNNLVNNGISGLIRSIKILAGLYIINRKF